MKNTLIQVHKNGMGSSEEALGLTLIEKYFELIAEEENLPTVIVFYNEGVKLLCESSPVLQVLQKLAERGVKLLACSTCLNYFKLAEKQQVGVGGSMLDIITLQRKSDKVITL